MRKLRKINPPDILIENQESWTLAYVAATPKERIAREKWRHPEIKTALREETNSKCAYCEAVLEDISFPHVEHMRPKSVFPELAHSWRNLTWACQVCNMAKGDYCDPMIECLNPYVDNPPSLVYSVGPMIDWVAGDARAEITVRRIQLNRPNLIQARANRISSVRDLYDRWYSSQGSLRKVLEQAVIMDATEGEFTETVISYLRSKKFPLDQYLGSQ